MLYTQNPVHYNFLLGTTIISEVFKFRNSGLFDVFLVWVNVWHRQSQMKKVSELINHSNLLDNRYSFTEGTMCSRHETFLQKMPSYNEQHRDLICSELVSALIAINSWYLRTLLFWLFFICVLCLKRIEKEITSFPNGNWVYSFYYIFHISTEEDILTKTMSKHIHFLKKLTLFPQIS